jgi:hypothetical protein
LNTINIFDRRFESPPGRIVFHEVISFVMVRIEKKLRPSSSGPSKNIKINKKRFFWIPLPPAEGHPVSPMMMGKLLAPILSRATLKHIQ